MKLLLTGKLLVLMLVSSLTIISASLIQIIFPHQSASVAFTAGDASSSKLTSASSLDRSTSPTYVFQREGSTLPSEEQLPRLDDFIRQIDDGYDNKPRGLYVEGIMALRIVQQPNEDPAYVSLERGAATQYFRAQLFGTIGLLAHNFLAGKQFLNLKSGQDLVLVYSGGRTEHFLVSEITDYQRLKLADIHSDFLNIDTQVKSSADQLFARYYERGYVLTLQTCISRNGSADWGVRFITALPISKN